MDHALVVDVPLARIARRRSMVAALLGLLGGGAVLGAAATGVQLVAQWFAGAVHELEAIPAPLLQGIQPGQGALAFVVGQGSRFLF